MKKQMYYECPLCGANLDWGEQCDCIERRAEQSAMYQRLTRTLPETGQMIFIVEDKKEVV